MSSESPAISIADLLENVKSLPLANEVFSLDVLEKLGVARTKGSLSDSVRYSLPLEDLTPAEEQAQEERQRDIPSKLRKTKEEQLAEQKDRAEKKIKSIFSTQGSYEILRSVYGLKDLSPKNIHELCNKIWRGMSACVSAEEKAVLADDTASYILSKLMNEDRSKKNPDADVAKEELAYLRRGIGRLTFSDTDVAELTHAFDKKGMSRIRGRWGYKGRGERYPMEMFVTDVAREMPGMAHLEDMHPAEAFKEIMARYDTARETSKEEWISAICVSLQKWSKKWSTDFNLFREIAF